MQRDGIVKSIEGLIQQASTEYQACGTRLAGPNAAKK
jgi:hypothetical protein